MAWGGREEFGERGLMGVRGDVLFADPLNVRGGSKDAARQGLPAQDEYRPYRQQSPPGRASGPREGPADRVGLEQTGGFSGACGDMKREDEQDDWGPVGNFLWWMVAGGRQCCSMRDRSKPSDAEAKAKLPESNRPPPERHLPDVERRGIDSFRPRDAPETAVYRGRDLATSIFSPHNDGESRRGGRGSRQPNSSEASDSDSSARASGRTPLEAWSGSRAGRELDRGLSGTGSSRGADVDHREKPIRSSREERGHAPRSDQMPTVPQMASASPSMPTMPQLGAPSASLPTDPQMDSDSSPVPHSLPTNPQIPVVGSIVPRWEWPTWCLNFKRPCIEVYVLDDDTGIGRWVHAEPQSRVVDKSGRDAYLCCEYEWDGEFYVQDFGPQHVRRRGEIESVFQSIQQPQAEMRGDDLEKTRLAPGRGKVGDTGAGVSALLADGR